MAQFDWFILSCDAWTLRTQNARTAYVLEQPQKGVSEEAKSVSSWKNLIKASRCIIELKKAN